MNSFPLRRSAPVPQRLSALAAILEIPPPGKDMEARGVAPLAAAAGDQIGFLAHRRYLSDLADSHAGALLVARDLEGFVSSDARPRFVVADAHAALTTLLEAFHPEEHADPEVHSTAILGHGVRMGREVRIGPYAVIERGAVLGDGVSIGAHVVVGAESRIGSGSILHPHCVLYPGSVLGRRVIVHAGARLGVDGFGYVYLDGAHRKVPQIGALVIEDDVEIGANTTIDRGSIGATRVGAGAKLDNLIHIGHNVSVGPRTIMAAQVGIAGSATIGAGVQMGGQAGVNSHICIGDGAKLAGQAGVVGDVAAGETVMGFPARPRTEFLRGVAAQAKLPDLIRRLRPLGSAEGTTGDDTQNGESR